MTVLFEDQGEKTKLTVIHDQLVSEAAMKDYEWGWNECLRSIEEELGKISYEFSPYLDVRVEQPEAAAKFYVENFGWKRISSDSHEHTLKFGPLTVFITAAREKAGKSNVHFEMATPEDILLVKQRLEKVGCTTCTTSMKKSFMFTDPFGNNFHIYQNN